MRLYHGSNTKIVVPDLSKSKRMERLIEELKFAKGLTVQYFFGTERALKTLRKL